MRLLQLQTSSKDLNKTVYRINYEFSNLKKQGIQIKIYKFIKGNYAFLNFFTENYHNTISTFYYHTAKAIAEIILDDFKHNFIRKIIKEDYDYFNPDEQIKLVKNAKRLLNKKKSHKEKIFYRVREFLEHNKTINIEGFIQFRLKEYTTEIEELIEKVVDEYLIEKEYMDFIKLLKYFVEIQEPKKEIVHVIMRNKGFDLLDGKLKHISHDFLKDFKDEILNNEIDKDDLLISVLISIAPKKVVIHSKKKLNNEIIDTLKNVFEDKIIFCKECNICDKNSDFENIYKI